MLFKIYIQICIPMYTWYVDLFEKGFSHKLIEACTMTEAAIPYNGIFSRRQIFAVSSKKHGYYFSRILNFAVDNVREK